MRTLSSMKPCPHCGSRQVRTGPKCITCGTTIEVAEQAEESGYKPGWLDSGQVAQTGRAGRIRGRSRTGESQAEEPRTKPLSKRGKRASRRAVSNETTLAPAQQSGYDIPVVRLQDETYVNGAFVDTTSVHGGVILPKQPYTLQDQPPAQPPTSTKKAVDEEEFFSPEFWSPQPPAPVVHNETPQAAVSGSQSPIRVTYGSSQVLGGGADPSNERSNQFTPGSFLDTSLRPGAVLESPTSRRSSRTWLVALCIVSVLAGTGVYLMNGGPTPNVSLPTLTTGSSPSSGDKAIASFGSPIQIEDSDAQGRDLIQLDASLFPVGCTKERTSITGYGYVVSAVGAGENESIALATGGALKECLEDRVAYLFDSTSALRVRIEGFDAAQGLVWLRVPAPLPGQPVATQAQPGDRKVGIYTNGVSAFVDPAAGSAAPGAPVLVEDGTVVALYGDTGTPLDLSTVCGTLFAC